MAQVAAEEATAGALAAAMVPVVGTAAPVAEAAGCPTASSRKSVIFVRIFQVPALAPVAVEAVLL